MTTDSGGPPHITDDQADRVVAALLAVNGAMLDLARPDGGAE